jgi:hypothetical protein
VRAALAAAVLRLLGGLDRPLEATAAVGREAEVGALESVLRQRLLALARVVADQMSS